MSSRGSGGNAEAMGQRGRGMGHDAVHGHGEHVQEYNGAIEGVTVVIAEETHDIWLKEDRDP